MSPEEISNSLGIRLKKLKKEIKRLNLDKAKKREDAPKTPLERASISLPNRKKIIVLAVLVFLAAAFVYINTLGSDFIWDDEYLILNNSQVKSFSHFFNAFGTYLGYGSENVNNFYRPLQEVSNMLDYFLWKEDATGFHLTNILFHATAALCVFIFVFYVCNNTGISFFTALLFAVHPIHTEAVAYIAGRADSLYSIFFLLSFIFFIRYSNRVITGKKRQSILFISGIFFILAIFSKEISMILPLLIAAYIWIIVKRDTPPRKFKTLKTAWLLYAGIVLGYVILRFTALNFFDIAPPTTLSVVPLVNRLFTFFKSVAVYIRLLLFPFGLHMEREIAVVRNLAEPAALLSFLLVAGIIASGVYFYRKNRAVSFFIFWFFINLLPVANIFPINSFIAEHWVYMASVGWFFCFSLIIYNTYNICGKNRLLKAGTILIALFLLFSYAGLTFERNKDWKDEITFFRSTIKASPAKSRLYLNLGNTYLEHKKPCKAIEMYEKVIEMRGADADAYGNMAAVYMSQGNLKKAEECAKKAINTKHNHAISHFNLGRIYYRYGDRNRAISELEIAVSQLPQLYQARAFLGSIYLEKGEKDKARRQFEESLRTMPDQPRVKRLLEKCN